jgi:hypothetical protein
MRDSLGERMSPGSGVSILRADFAMTSQRALNGFNRNAPGNGAASMRKFERRAAAACQRERPFGQLIRWVI